MDKLFNPQSIAIIGASHHREKIGFQILNNLISSGYQGKIFPVNPDNSPICNLATYKDISLIQDQIDVALIAVPSKGVFTVLKQCALKNISNAIIISAGFSEVGKEGQELQQKIKNEIIDRYPIRVIGPNCLGIINTSNNLNLTFAAPKIIKGNVAAVFQSGALGAALLDLAGKYEFGFSKFISLGNKIDLEESELIEYLARDPETKIIALYLEEVTKPLNFFINTRLASLKKPIVILKGGITQLGAKAAFSHTAAMVGSREINNAIFTQANLIKVKNIEELLNVVSLLNSEPQITQKNVAIITNAGGPGIITSDAVYRHGFNLTKPKKTIKLNSLSHNSSLTNPFDLTGTATAHEYESLLEQLSRNHEYSAIIALLTPQTVTEVEKTASVISKYSPNIPILASFLGDKSVAAGIEILRKNKVSHFEDPEEGIIALKKIIAYFQKRQINSTLISIVSNIKNLKPAVNPLQLISEYNIKIPEYAITSNLNEGLNFFKSLGSPVAIKSASPTITHKYRAGKVVLNVQNENDYRAAIKHVGFPAILQKMVDAPIEIIIGAKRHQELGIIATFGWGGIFTEDLGDIATRIFPLTNADLDEMIKETRIGKVLIKEEMDLNNIKEIIVKIGQIMTDYPSISEMDLNPIKVLKSSVICVDARFK